MIAAEDITGVDATLARRVIVHARSIAPCLESLDGDMKKDAVALLTGVAAEAAARGARHVRAQRIGPASVDYGPASSWFTDDDRRALRALCGAAAGGLPLGSFPRPGIIGRLWPEDC